MSPGNRKAGERRLANMSAAAERPAAWTPDVHPAECEEYEQTFPISETVCYIQRMLCDERDRVVEWAVVQMRCLGGQWQRVAVYDICHRKGVHVHLYNRHGTEFDEQFLMEVASYRDIEDGLDYAVQRVTESWTENERRSDLGH